jgi:class 3 adenylate cyclase
LELGGVVIEFADRARKAAGDFNGTVDGDALLSLLHVLVAHFLPIEIELETAVSEDMPGVTISQFAKRQSEMLAVMIVVCVVLGVAMSILQVVCGWTFDGMVGVIRRLPPEGIMRHGPLLNYILGANEDAEAMGVARGTIYMAPDVIFVLSADLLIDSVNPAVQRTLHFSPEVLLGQNIALVYAPGAAVRLQRTAVSMQRRECALSFQEEARCQAADGVAVPASVTLIGMAHGRSTAITSFVVLLKDLRPAVALREEAEAAKARSEDLLCAILPPPMMARLKQGERDIACVVESGSSAFVDIDKFGDYAALLAPQETIRCLAEIFEGYDRALVQYPLCMRMRLIGDVYMMMSGLFSPDIDAREHAEQTIRFCLDALTAIEDFNQRRDANLGLRIGVNTGGPLMMGVLEGDCPVFEVVGDPINVARRLSWTSPVGKVQISEETFVLVKGLDFHVAPHGMVALRGVGERPVYVVSKPTRQSVTRELGTLLAGGPAAQLLHGSGLGPSKRPHGADADDGDLAALVLSE